MIILHTQVSQFTFNIPNFIKRTENCLKFINKEVLVINPIWYVVKFTRNSRLEPFLGYVPKIGQSEIDFGTVILECFG